MNNKIPIDAYQRKDIRRVGQHEGGHYMVSRTLGFKAGAISIIITDLSGGHSASTEVVLAQEINNIDSVVDYLEKRIIVLYAGVLAESLTNGEIDNDMALNSLKKGGGKTDFDKARELLQLLRNIRHPNSTSEDDQELELGEINHRLWNASADSVKEQHFIIEGLGSRLASEIKYVGDSFVINEDELNSLPAIKDHFNEE